MESEHQVESLELIVKIDKMVFMETYICDEWMQLHQECQNHCQEDINEHQKKRYETVMDVKVIL
jgi:hypothetical protein